MSCSLPSPSFDRRGFLRVGAASLAGLGLRPLKGAVLPPSRAKNLIVIMMVGGPSQLDTWDMKPGAPTSIRGPFRPIRTNVSGIEISEIFPRMARNADKFALVRSCFHTAGAVHDAGHQVVQTGRAFDDGMEYPHVCSVASRWAESAEDFPAHVLLPTPIGRTGGNMSHGQTAAFLGREHDPLVLNPDAASAPRALSAAADLQTEPESVRARYGGHPFGRNCLVARRLIESGVRFVTLNMFDTVFDRITWDMHGYQPFSSIDSYKNVVGPAFDQGYSALLEDLHDRGRLAETLVVTLSEFGRTPYFNLAGGRDHWPQCWTTIIAGGGIQGGQVIGSSDAAAAEPRDRPVAPGEMLATVYHALGIEALAGQDAAPVHELF